MVQNSAVQSDEALLPTPGRRLRLLIITEEDPIYVIQFFRVFLAEIPPSEFEICGIVIQQAFHEPLHRTLRRMVGFYGPLGTARLGFRFLRAHLRNQTIRALAAPRGMLIVPTQSVNDPSFIQTAAALEPDLLVSVAAPEIFRRQLLDVPKLGAINIHSGRLPEYRGMLPSFWQMARKESSVTITVHRMAEKVDAGEILGTQTFPLSARDNLDRVISGTKQEGARLLIRVLQQIRNGTAVARPLDLSRAGYFSFPKASDVSAFRRLGHRLL
jgi:methionyl-tRNA formyltransferase